MKPYLGGLADEAIYGLTLTLTLTPHPNPNPNPNHNPNPNPNQAIYGRKINNIARTPLPKEKTSVHELYDELVR